MYSQAPLLKLLRAGKIPGESGIPEHIETVLSNIFLFKERVYKVYKNDNEFVNKNFGNISTREKRFAFSRTDFDWNHQLAEEIYLRLQGVKVDTGVIRFLDTYENAEELLLVTKRLPAEASLFEHLQKKDIAESEYYGIGKQFARREGHFVPDEVPPKESVLENMSWRLDDIVAWVKGVESQIPQKEREEYIEELKNLTKRVYVGDTAELTISFDVHSLNAFYVDGVFYPFDTVASKDAWRFGPNLLSVFRLATDVFAFVGEKEFGEVLRGYYEYSQTTLPSEEKQRLLVIYAGLIMMPYLYMLGKTDSDKQKAAIKYHDFLKRYVSRTLDL
jgi:aminoglycoside phosphotransferase family enzyme